VIEKETYTNNIPKITAIQSVSAYWHEGWWGFSTQKCIVLVGHCLEVSQSQLNTM